MGPFWAVWRMDGRVVAFAAEGVEVVSGGGAEQGARQREPVEDEYCRL